MKDRKAFLEKVRKDIKGAKITYILYDGEDLISIRQNSKKILSIRDDELVGVYDATSKNADIIDDCLAQIEEYDRKQAKQSKRLDQALGMA